MEKKLEELNLLEKEVHRLFDLFPFDDVDKADEETITQLSDCLNEVKSILKTKCK